MLSTVQFSMVMVSLTASPSMPFWSPFQIITLRMVATLPPLPCTPIPLMTFAVPSKKS
jgi:hypothetical protein